MQSDAPAAALPGAEAGTPDNLLDLIGQYGLARQVGDDGDMAEAYRLVHEATAALASELARLTEDKARLDWLDERREAIEDVRTVGRQVGDDEWEPEQVRELLGHRWDGIEGQCDTIREAIDAARLASPSPTGAE